jgi:hypothetical protein
MAVVAGLAAPEHRGSIIEVLKRERHASPYMEKYVLEALMQLDAPDAALDRMTERYAAMLSDDVGTLWELFDPITLEGFGDLGRGTYNHAWSGGPLTILSQYVAGVAPTSPAFKTFDVSPNLGRLNRVDAVVPTLDGPIRVNARKEAEGALSVTVEAPPGTIATVWIPAKEASAVTLNDRPFPLEVLSASTNSPALEGRRGNRLGFRVPAGVWRFAVPAKAGGTR